MVEVELSQLTFTLLDEDGRDHVRRGMDLAFFERDEIILEMGQPGVSVFLIHKGEVAECTGDNIFLVSKGQLLTPPIDAGILDGITRGAVIELARAAGITVREIALTRHDVYIADEVFLTGTAVEVIAVVKLDSRKIGAGVPGPITRDLKDRFHKLTRG